MIGIPVYAKNDAGMLNRAAGIAAFCADCVSQDMF